MRTILFFIFFLLISSCDVKKQDNVKNKRVVNNKDTISIGNKLDFFIDGLPAMPAGDVHRKFGEEEVIKFQKGMYKSLDNSPQNVINKKIGYFRSYKLKPQTLKYFFDNKDLNSDGLKFTFVEIKNTDYGNIIDYSNLSIDNGTSLYIIISFYYSNQQFYIADKNYISFNLLGTNTDPTKIDDDDLKNLLKIFKNNSMKVFDDYYCRIDEDLNLTSNTRSIVYYWKDLEELRLKSKDSNSIDFQFAEIIDVEDFIRRNPAVLTGKEPLYLKHFKDRKDQITLLGNINRNILAITSETSPPPPLPDYFDMGDLRP
jgi:hypothetical protein